MQKRRNSSADALELRLFCITPSPHSIYRDLCTRFALCCVWLWFVTGWFRPCPSRLLHWHCDTHPSARCRATMKSMDRYIIKIKKKYYHLNKTIHNQTVSVFMRYIVACCASLSGTEHLAGLWGHSMQTLADLLALCEGNPPVTNGLLLQWTWCLCNVVGRCFVRTV